MTLLLVQNDSHSHAAMAAPCCQAILNASTTVASLHNVLSHFQSYMVRNDSCSCNFKLAALTFIHQYLNLAVVLGVLNGPCRVIQSAGLTHCKKRQSAVSRQACSMQSQSCQAPADCIASFWCHFELVLVCIALSPRLRFILGISAPLLLKQTAGLLDI